MKALFGSTGCATTLERDGKLPNEMMTYTKSDILEKAHIAILLCLIDEALHKVVDRTTSYGLWEKLCDTYQNNPLTNQLY